MFNSHIADSRFAPAAITGFRQFAHSRYIMAPFAIRAVRHRVGAGRQPFRRQLPGLFPGLVSGTGYAGYSGSAAGLHKISFGMGPRLARHRTWGRAAPAGRGVGRPRHSGHRVGCRRIRHYGSGHRSPSFAIIGSGHRRRFAGRRVGTGTWAFSTGHHLASPLASSFRPSIRRARRHCFSRTLLTGVSGTGHLRLPGIAATGRQPGTAPFGLHRPAPRPPAPGGRFRRPGLGRAGDPPPPASAGPPGLLARDTSVRHRAFSTGHRHLPISRASGIRPAIGTGPGRGRDLAAALARATVQR